MKKLGIIGAGGPALMFATNAREMGVETHCFAWAQGAVAKDAVDYFHEVSIMDTDAVVALCRKIGIDGIVPTSEGTIGPAGVIAHELGLNGNPVETAQNIADKLRNRLRTQGVEGLHHPAFYHMESYDDLDLKAIPYPFVIKPRIEGGSRGVTIVQDENDLEVARAYSASEPNRSGTYLVEGYLDGGRDFGVETISFHGTHHVIQMTDQDCSGAPHPVELGFHMPADFTDDERELVADVCRRMLDAAGVENGPCHSEFKLIDGKVFLIEINGRSGGDHMASDLVELSCGYPYVKGVISCALDEFEAPDPQAFEHHWAGITFVCEQTRQLLPLFETCEDEPWCVERHVGSDGMAPRLHNTGATSHIIYRTDSGRPDFTRI